jgi:prepilin-type N-terminal cleavage/methylation domain-containing protein/prepilin-type processing-associated H-X9-DG protein
MAAESFWKRLKKLKGKRKSIEVMVMNTGKKKFRGFTLIELLVVVAIIAVLVAILLPSLGRARESARSAMCAANLKQLGMGLQYYAEDNKGYWPAPIRNTPAVITWDVGLSPYLSESMTFGPSDATNRKKGKSVFVCPSDQTPRRTTEAVEDYMRIARSYGLVCWKKSPTWAWAYFDQYSRVTEFSDPSQRFLATEWHWEGNTRGMNWRGAFINHNEWRYGFDPEDWYEADAGLVSPSDAGYHNGNLNYLFMDGHVASLNKGDADKDVYWSYP